jgi:hypothetical protein
MNTTFARLLVLGLLLGAAPAAAAVTDPCGAPEGITGTIAALPRVAPVLKPGGVLRVLAVGSATMFGPDASLMPGTLTSQALTRPTSPPGSPVVPPAAAVPPIASESAFPQQMALALEAAVPGLKVEVVSRGGRGMAATEMLGLIRKELAASPFQLVLWQTGTVEAVRNSPPGEFAQVLADGAEAIEAANANLILIDPQYSRFLQTNSDLNPYTQALQETASMPGVVLFRRYELMHNWVSEGQIDLERTPKPDRRKTVELLHRCLGQHLARMVMAGVHAASGAL